jgi:hypothetical protein
MLTLKPEAELTIAALTIGTVYSVWQVEAPSLDDVRASQSGNQHVYSAVKSATWSSAAVVCGLALLARSPLVFIVGAATTAAEAWKYHYANAVNPATGKPQTADDSE